MAEQMRSYPYLRQSYAIVAYEQGRLHQQQFEAGYGQHDGQRSDDTRNRQADTAEKGADDCAEEGCNRELRRIMRDCLEAADMLEQSGY